MSAPHTSSDNTVLICRTDLQGRITQQLSTSVGDIAVAVQQLASSTESIGAITNIISSIAGQTNLLALNAGSASG